MVLKPPTGGPGSVPRRLRGRGHVRNHPARGHNREVLARDRRLSRTRRHQRPQRGLQPRHQAGLRLPQPGQLRTTHHVAQRDPPGRVSPAVEDPAQVRRAINSSTAAQRHSEPHIACRTGSTSTFTNAEVLRPSTGRQPILASRADLRRNGQEPGRAGQDCRPGSDAVGQEFGQERVVIVVRVTDSSDNGRHPAHTVVERCAPAGHHPTTAAAALAGSPRGDSTTWEYVREVVAAAPPLTPEQFYRLRGLILHAKPAEKASRASEGAA